MKKRISWDEYFLSLTHLVATRSTCLRHDIGAIAVKDKRILATGYNGAPSGIKHCIDRGGCLRDRYKIESGTNQQKCFSVHAEENVIIQAAIHGISLKGATLYCTHSPCVMCMRKIINAKFSQLIYVNGYPDEMAKGLLIEAYKGRTTVDLIGDYENVSFWYF